MADEKKLHPPQWLGHPILADEHVRDLETRSAINEFHHKMPRGQAEQAAHDSYVKENRERAAAHHLAGMKAATATGNHQDARKHWAMYDLHLKALGKESIGAVPPEVEKRMMDESDKPIYKFKTHKGDLYALHEPSKDAAPPEGQPMTKAEAGQCKWKLGERRCQRQVKADYCHDHVNHWANKIKQKEASAVPMEKGDLPPAAPPGGVAHLAAPAAPKPAAAAPAAAPQLHSSVEGFLGGLKQHPQGSPARSQFIAQHVNHAPLAQAFASHPDPKVQGMWKPIVQMGMKYANSSANAGFKPGQTKTMVKAELLDQARAILAGVLQLAKGTLLQFPGNKAPAVDQGQAAPVAQMPVKPAAVPKSWSDGVAETMADGPQAAAPDPTDYSHLVPQGMKAKLKVTPHEGGHLAELTDPKGLVLGSLHGRETGDFQDRGYWGVKDPVMAWKDMLPAQHRQALPWMQMAIHQARGTKD